MMNLQLAKILVFFYFSWWAYLTCGPGAAAPSALRSIYAGYAPA